MHFRYQYSGITHFRYHTTERLHVFQIPTQWRDCMHLYQYNGEIDQYNGIMHCRYKYNGEIACIADISTIERLHAFHDTCIHIYYMCV